MDKDPNVEAILVNIFAGIARYINDHYSKMWLNSFGIT